MKKTSNRYANIEYEEILCPFCKKADYDIILDFVYYNLVRCSDCGLTYVNPQPKAEATYDIYDDNYLNYLLANAERSISFFQEKVQIIQNIIPSGKVLDIGFGAGYFLKLMMERCYNVYGVEISQSACSFVKSKHQIEKVYCCDLLNADLRDIFDIITFWDSLQGMPQPIEHIEKATQLLNPGGLMVIQVPNRSASNINYAKFLYKLNKNLSRNFLHIPTALTLFDSQILFSIAHKMGLHVVCTNQSQAGFRMRLTKNVKAMMSDIVKNGYSIISRIKRENVPLIFYLIRSRQPL